MVTQNANGCVVAFRGTTELAQWLSYITQAGASPCSVVGGQTFGPFEAWSNEIAGRLRGQLPVDTRLAFCGHSLGGAMALLTAAKIAGMGFQRPVVYTSGCPLVGDADFVEAYLPTAHNTIRVIDPVVSCPPSALANPLFCPFGRPLLPRFFRPGHQWVLPSVTFNWVATATWVIATDASGWVRRLPKEFQERHNDDEYLSQAWAICDHEDREAVSAWGVIAKQYFGLDVQTI
jgi:pimeloyl-ACP methyl ester carboxylesterase